MVKYSAELNVKKKPSRKYRHTMFGVEFPNKVVVKFEYNKGNNGKPNWLEMILYDTKGNEVGRSEKFTEIDNELQFEYDGNEYNIKLIDKTEIN